MKFKNLKKCLIGIAIFALFVFPVAAQELTSNNYKILDPSIDSGGGTSSSTNYDLIQSIGNPAADARLTSTSYELASGFPNGIQANVPLVRCAETTTNSGSTTCVDFPNANGAQGECGTPGCYDRAKIEIDHQNNPIDALYLVGILDTVSSIQYYLQSDHSISTTYDISDYMTLCSIQGKDTRAGSGCVTGGDPNWNASLQSTNVSGLVSNRAYQITVRALNGDFTESRFSPSVNVTTSVPTLVFDIDIGTTSGVNTNAPYSVALGTLDANIVKTATDLIWLDMGTNVVNGMNLYAKDNNAGLFNGTTTIGSDAEDLATDPDADGGYGLKINTSTETSLGIIQEGSTYATAGADQVGNLALSDILLFFTNTSGGNKGQVSGGRGSAFVKALVKTNTPTGNYTDTITFTMTATP